MHRSFCKNLSYFVGIIKHRLLSGFLLVTRLPYEHLRETNPVSCFNLITQLTVARLIPTTAAISLFILAMCLYKVMIFVRFLSVNVHLAQELTYNYFTVDSSSEVYQI